MGVIYSITTGDSENILKVRSDHAEGVALIAHIEMISSNRQTTSANTDMMNMRLFLKSTFC